MGRHKTKGGKSKSGGGKKPQSDPEAAYRHGPETELESILVFAAQEGDLSLLEATLEVGVSN